MINFIPYILSKLNQNSIHYSYLQVADLAEDFNLALNSVIDDENYLYFKYLIDSFFDSSLNELKNTAMNIYLDICPHITDLDIAYDFTISDLVIESSTLQFLPKFPTASIDHLTIVDSDFVTILGLPNVKSLSLYKNPYLVHLYRFGDNICSLEVVDSLNLRTLKSIPSSVSDLILVNNPKLNIVEGDVKFLKNLTMYGNEGLSAVRLSDCDYIESSYVSDFEAKLIDDLLN